MGNPIQTFRAGACMATIFENTVKVDGKEVHLPTVSLQRRYRDTEGIWKTATSMRLNDMPKAIVVLAKAYAWLVSTRREDRDVPR